MCYFFFSNSAEIQHMQGEGYQNFQLWSGQPTDIVVPFKRRYYSLLAGVCNKICRNMPEMFKKLTLIRFTNASSIECWNVAGIPAWVFKKTQWNGRAKGHWKNLLTLFLVLDKLSEICVLVKNFYHFIISHSP